MTTNVNTEFTNDEMAACALLALAYGNNSVGNTLLDIAAKIAYRIGSDEIKAKALDALIESSEKQNSPTANAPSTNAVN